MPRLSKIGAACLAAFGYTQGTSTIAANYLVVAGGGGGGGSNTGGQGGGGAGGLLLGITNLNYTLNYVITVGAGGAGATSNVAGTNGANSAFDTFSTAIGGGGGGTGAIPINGSNGGSGGGAGYQGTSGTGTVGQGNNGGTGGITGAGNSQGGGGGGAGAVGGNSSANTAGNGGNGTASSISGSSVTYAGGGGGGNQNQTLGGSGGTGGGGAGAKAAASPVAGTTNLGGGGGGGGGGASGIGAAGGSGVVIISYTSPTQLFGGGIVTYSGGNWIHTFTTSGTLVPVTTFTANLLAIAGGASGGAGSGGFGAGGGGGAGEYYSASSIKIDTNSNYIITIGAGGAGVAGPGGTSAGSDGNNGSNSIALIYTVKGGGFGSGAHTLANGGSGGSGGGAGGSVSANGIGGSALPFIGVGFAGGTATTQYDSRGGGGSGGTTTTTAGGIGLSNSISGTAVSYAGGGGGAINVGAGGAGQAGGGNGGSSGAAGTAATANSGSGGGGGGNTGTGAASGNGGSGIVIISYAGAQRMAGGTVTFVGGNTIHTFTSSGYLSALKLVNNSLRFKASTSSYLNRTFGTPTTQAKWTWSGWVKRGTLGSLVRLMSSGTTASDTTTTTVYFSASDTLAFSGGTTNFRISNQVFRDPAAWYHIVIAVDTTQAVEANKILIYVNGVQITFATTNAITTCAFNSAQTAYIGQFNSSQYFDGYMAEINFVDGQQLTASSFGGYNSFGVWQPTQYLGSFGNNGFYLPFTNNASSTTIGYDFSPNQNNWASTGFTLTPTTSVNYDSMTDVPTLTSATASNFAVMNPLSIMGSGNTLTNGNLTFSGNGSTNIITTGTFGMSSGKWYVEATITNGSGGVGFGIAKDIEPRGSATVGNTANSWGYNSSNGAIANNSSTISTGATYTTNDVVAFALNMDAGTLTFYKNNAAQGSTVTGLSGTFLVAVSGYLSTINLNFGQKPFAGTVPTGFVALNTFNM